MKVFVALLAALTAQMASAACPNQCSGKGRCTNRKPWVTSTAGENPFRVNAGADDIGTHINTKKKDSCVCFIRNEDGANVFDYTFPDCSGKVCPSGNAHNQIPFQANDHSQVIECSGVGSCDRSTGKCACQPGFTGKGCQRRTCPNDCNGRGKCHSLTEIVELVTEANANLDWTSSGLGYTGKDAASSHGCWCDPGFRGPDCSIMECPSKTDPMGGKGSESGRECSGRGTCDGSVGLCQCQSGFTGTACEQQLVNHI